MSGAISSLGSGISAGAGAVRSGVTSLFATASTAARGAGGIPLPVPRPSTSLFGSFGNFVGGTASLFQGIATAAAPLVVLGATRFQSQAILNQAAIESSAAEFNAQVAERDAALATFSAEEEAKDVRRGNVKRLKSIRAAFGKGGVATSSGSALTVQLEAAEQGELEAQRTLFSGQLQADAANIRASQQRLKGTIARSAGAARSTQTLLTGTRNFIG